MRVRRSAFFAAAITLSLGGCRSTAPVVSPDISGRITSARSLMTRSDIAAAQAFVDTDRQAILTQWQTLTEIPAPSGQETRRAAAVEALLRQYALSDVHTDSAGNVTGTRKGSGGGAHVVFDAHLDTVFAMSTNVKTRIENGQIYAPGVGDDTRNIAALLAMIRAMDAAKVITRGDVTFVFTTQEETDFKGVNQFLADNAANIDRYVTLDGGYRGFTYGGIGIYWYRYHIIGPGGHTRSDTPPYSATLPAARAIERIYKLKVGDESYVNIGMTGAGDVFNAKAEDAWFSLDLRSNDEPTLKRMEGQIEGIVRDEAAREKMTVKRDVVSTEEVAAIPGHRTSEMVQTVEAVWRAFGFDPAITNTASNHTSAALRAGVPAIGTGVGPCEGSHSLEEHCEIEPIYTGIKRNIVLAAALADQDPRPKPGH